ncbi:hypothetical protein NDU88_007277 [Pleurodeles waltl]|uniref:Uncharacterized protein n=1 Tax=Pleurodeles waltl TaxID=8319 RepID=A0AAV7SS93_PLEWA|nr:hypothetical protein NDU88_007277 [Pleurodeles waltl]
MCGPLTMRDGSELLLLVEGRKAAGVGHWNRAALELCHTRQGVARFPLRGNNSSGSTSKAAGEKKEELGAAARRSAKGAAAAGVEVGRVGGMVRVRPKVISRVPGQAKSQNNLVLEDPGPQIMEQLGDVSGIFENSVLSSPQANGGFKEGQARALIMLKCENDQKYRCEAHFKQ